MFPRRLALAAVCAALTLASGRAAEPPHAGAAILLYHRFGPTAASTTVSDAALDEQLAWLAAHVHVAPLRTVLAALRAGATAADRPCVAITVDDGHRSVYTDLYPRILHDRLPVTLFIYPSAISNASYALTWPQLAEMAASGLVDIQSHTDWHPNFHTEKAHRAPADYQAFVDTQLTRSRSVLEAKIGKPVDMLAWPFGIDDPDLETAAARAGYTAAFTMIGRAAEPDTDPFALPRFWIADSDRPARLAAKLAPACPISTDQK